jgi:hypothetical protein
VNLPSFLSNVEQMRIQFIQIMKIYEALVHFFKSILDFRKCFQILRVNYPETHPFGAPLAAPSAASPEALRWRTFLGPIKSYAIWG